LKSERGLILSRQLSRLRDKITSEILCFDKEFGYG